MKRIIYFILAILTIVYIAFLCYVNIMGSPSQALNYVAIYGGLAIALAYAIVNFFGNPLKILFLVLLIIAVIVLILTIAVPDIFRNLFGLTAEAVLRI